MKITRKAFLLEYAEKLKLVYPWANDASKLQAHIANAVKRLNDPATRAGVTVWHFESPVVARTWRTLGGTGQPSLTQLQALE